MSYLNIDAQAQNTYDAIVIGSGISGGWAAKELTGKGLRILVLERGRDVRHVTNYPTTNTQPWEFEHRGQLTTPYATPTQSLASATPFMRVRSSFL
jgi:choline dehydrogenase-like flavoprotein